MSFLTWLFGSRTGRELLAAAGIALAIYALWHHVDSAGFRRGQNDVQARWDAAVAGARQKAAQHVSAQAQAGAAVAADAGKKADEAHTQVVKTVTETKEVIRNVYVDRPVVVPASAAACLRAVDDRVQRRLELGMDQARSAAR